LEREGQFTAETVASLDDKGVLYDKMLDMKVGIDRRNAGTTIYPLLGMTSDHMNLTHLQGRKKWTLVTTQHFIHAIINDDPKKKLT
jgi:hypothetical protein